MKIIPLTCQERSRHLATHKVIVDYTDLTDADSAQTIQLLPYGSGTVPAGTTVRFAGMKLNTTFDFSDTSVNSLAVTVGDGDDADRFLTSTELAADGSYVSNKTTAASSQPHTYDAADGIDAVFTASGGGSPTVAEATSGEVEFYLFVSNNARLVAGR